MSALTGMPVTVAPSPAMAGCCPASVLAAGLPTATPGVDDEPPRGLTAVPLNFLVASGGVVRSPPAGAGDDVLGRLLPKAISSGGSTAAGPLAGRGTPADVRNDFLREACSSFQRCKMSWLSSQQANRPHTLLTCR